MSSKQFECPRCYKRCGNGGGLKTHMKTHKKPEPKSGTMLKWIVKRKIMKSESKPKPKEPIELKPIRKQRQLKLRKPAVREPTVFANTAHPRPPRRPRRSKQPPIDVGPFVASARLTSPDLDKRSPQYRIAHVQHFRALKADFPVLDKKMCHEANKSSLGVSLRRFHEWFHQYEKDLERVRKPKPKPKERYQNKVVYQADKKRSLASMDVPGPPPGTPPKRFKPNQSKPSSIPSRR